MSTTYIAMIVAIIMGIGLLVGIAALSLLSGALNFLFVKPKIEILKSKHGKTGFAFSFRWDQDAEPVRFNILKVKLLNPFGTPAQIEIIREFDASDVDFVRDIDLGLPMSNLLTATNMDKALVEIEMLASRDNISHTKTYKGQAFLDMYSMATLSTDEVAEKFVVEKVKPRFEIPEKSFISPPLPKTAKQLKMASNPMFAGEFAGMAVAGGGTAEAAPNYTVSKVWIEPGCIVCDACEAIAPKVFEVTDTTCIIRPGAPLDDGRAKQERILFNAFLLMEQLFGPRIFRLFKKSKAHIQLRQLRRLETTPAAEKNTVERITGIDEAEFQTKYFNKSTPVIFSGAALEWPCVKKWNLEYFSLGYGKKDVLLVNAEGLTSRESHTDFEFLTIKDLIENIKMGGDKYLRFSPLLENNPQLVEDLDMNWLGKMKGLKTFASTYYMFIGGKGKKTLLHTDQPCNLYVQVYGEKKWTLFASEDSSLLYPEVSNTAYVKSPLDVDFPDHDKYPLFKYARPYVAHLRPGDILYVPPHTWHFVENLDDTIAVGYRFSSLKAALKSSKTLSLLRVLSTNPPLWKTMSYGKIDTNLIWAHAGGTIKELLKARESRNK